MYQNAPKKLSSLLKYSIYTHGVWSFIFTFHAWCLVIRSHTFAQCDFLNVNYSACPPIFSMQHSSMELAFFSTGTQFLSCSYNHIFLSYQYHDCIAQGVTQCLWTLKVKREILFDLYVLFAIVICSVSVSALKLISLIVSALWSLLAFKASYWLLKRAHTL